MCVCGWVAKEAILSSASLTSIRVSKGTPLSTLAQRPYKELCPQKPAKPEEKDEESQSVRSESRELESYDNDLMSQHSW